MGQEQENGSNGRSSPWMSGASRSRQVDPNERYTHRCRRSHRRSGHGHHRRGRDRRRKSRRSGTTFFLLSGLWTLFGLSLASRAGEACVSKKKRCNAAKIAEFLLHTRLPRGPRREQPSLQ